MPASKEPDSDKVFETINPALHQYFNMATDELDSAQAIFDEIITNEKRYNQGTVINQGGMKKILKIDDSLTGRPVAMATLKNQDDANKVERFLREARLTAALEHPNIIPVYDIGLNQDEQPFFTMKLIGGKNLAQILKELSQASEGTPFSLQSLIDVFIKICDAIAYSHSKGILHLDLKPANIQIGEYGEVIVCDWGLAKIVDSPEDNADCDLDPCLYNDITLDGTIKGTPGFMAPEQIETELGDKDKRSDIYALGGILYNLLSLQAPLKADDIQKTLDDTLRGNITPPSALGLSLNIPQSLEAVALKALRKDPDKRYQNVAELSADIHKWQHGFATSAENAGFIKAASLLLKRHKAVASLLLFILISLIFSIATIANKEKAAREALSLYEEEKRQTDRFSTEASERNVTLALIALQANEFENAVELIDRGLEINPNNIFAYAQKGRIHFFRQEFHTALENFSKAEKHEKLIKKYVHQAQKYAALKTDNELLPSQTFIELLKNYTNSTDLFRLFRFEVANYQILKEHVNTCHFMLKLHNQQQRKLNFKPSYNDGSLALDISSNSKLLNLNSIGNLPIKKLNISNTGVVYTKQIEKMPLVELNIANSNIRNIKPLINMKSLKRIIINKDKWVKLKLPKGSNLEVIRI